MINSGHTTTGAVLQSLDDPWETIADQTDVGRHAKRRDTCERGFNSSVLGARVIFYITSLSTLSRIQTASLSEAAVFIKLPCRLNGNRVHFQSKTLPLVNHIKFLLKKMWILSVLKNGWWKNHFMLSVVQTARAVEGWLKDYLSCRVSCVRSSISSEAPFSAHSTTCCFSLVLFLFVCLLVHKILEEMGKVVKHW